MTKEDEKLVLNQDCDWIWRITPDLKLELNEGITPRDIADAIEKALDEPEIPEWEKNIDYFAKLLDDSTEENKGTKRHKILNYQGKRLNVWLKDFIREEFKKMSNDIELLAEERDTAWWFSGAVDEILEDVLKKRGIS